MSTSVVTYQKGTVDREVNMKLVSHTVTTQNDTDNSAAITVSDMSTVRDVIHALVESTTGVFRVPQGVVSKATNVVTVADTGLAVNEIIHLTVVGYAVAP